MRSPPAAPRKAPGGYDAGVQMLTFYGEMRQTLPWMPQWPEILPDENAIEAETRGLNAGGFPRFVVGDDYVLPRGTGLHESTHAVRLVANKRNGGEVLVPYLALRGFGFTLEQMRAQMNAATSENERWMLDPNESFAEAGRIALMGGGSEKTMNYGRELNIAGMRAFLKSLGPVAPAPQPTPPEPLPTPVTEWNDPITTNGRCPFAVWDPSPNYSPGWVQTVRGTMQHSTVSTFAAALSILKNGNSSGPVSAHFLIGLDGKLVQLVSLANRSWAQRTCNETHWSIEHTDDGDHADPVRTPAEYATSARLNAWLAKMGRYPIDADHLPPHRSCVNTACPSGLDLERIILEARGGDMADYVPRAEYDTFVAGLKNTITYIGDRLAKDAHHAHASGEPIEPKTVGRARIAKAFPGVDLSFLEASQPRRAAKRPTRAQARAGHGR